MRILLVLAVISLWAASAAAQTPAPTPVVVPPALGEFVPAEYPPSVLATENPPLVEVLLSLDIDAKGAVTKVVVLQAGGDLFDAAATAAAQQFRFSPATVNGVPTPVRIQYKYVFTPPVPAVVIPVENLSGEVYDRFKKTPLNGVKVALPELQIETLTGESGRFGFLDIPPGEYRIELSRAGYVAVNLQQVIGKDKKIDIRVAMEEPLVIEGDEELVIDDEAVIRGAKVVKEVTETTIDRSQGEKVAGTQGDVVKVVQTLGGVGRAAAGSSELVVWGASPSDTRQYIDGVPVPRLFHLGGGRSVLSSRLVKSVSLVPGGYGASYGRGIGGLVNVETLEPEPGTKDREVFASLDPIDVAVGTKARLGSRVWGALAVRRSVQNQTFDLVAPDRSKELVPIPDYWDYQTKSVVRIDGSTTLQIVVFGANDRNERGIPGITPDSGFSETSELNFHRVGARLRKVDDKGVTTEVAPWLGIDRSDTTLDFRDVKAVERLTAFRGGARISERRALSDHVTLVSGLDLELASTTVSRDGALSLPAREGDINVFGFPPGNRVNVDEWTVGWAAAGVYAAAAIGLWQDRISLEPGFRIEPSIINGERIQPARPVDPEVGYSKGYFSADPRFRGAIKVTSGLELFAATGRYHQPPGAGDLSPVFGNPFLEQSEAIHALAGLKTKPRKDVEIDVVGFWVKQDSLVVRADSPTPPTAKLLTNEGQGRNYGAQVALRYRPAENIFAWLTYSAMRAERKDHDAMSWRLFDSDQTHVLQMLGSWEHSSGLQLGGRMLMSSGFPRTPVESTVFDAGAARYDPVFGAQNSERIPLFFQLSARVAFEGKTSFAQYKIWLDIQNISNRANKEEIIYSSDFRQRSYIEGLPIFPLLGAEIRI